MNSTQESINDIITTIKFYLEDVKRNVDKKIESCSKANLEIELSDYQETLLTKAYKQNKNIIRKYTETSKKLLNANDEEKLLKFLKEFRAKLPALIRDVSLHFSSDSFISQTYFDLELYKQEKDLVDTFITILTNQQNRSVKLNNKR